MAIEFEYTRKILQDGSIGIGRPLIWIDLESPTVGTFSYPCLVDSGADDCAFDAEIGEMMGLDVKSGDRDEAFGLKKDATLVEYIHPITYSIQDINCKADVAFTYELSSDFGLLGRKGFFDQFLVKIDDREGKFEIEPYDKGI
ncbi:MAG TPA: hypothetical protein VGA53_00045 [Candidatus Paceibacterota bacterium]